MGRVSRRGVVLGLGLAAIGLGCGGMNPFLLPYLWSDRQGKNPPEFPLNPPKKGHEAKVVVFVSSKMGLPADLTGVDRMLNAELIQTLDVLVKSNDEKVQLLKMPPIDKFKSENPNWRSSRPYEDIGKKFAADYVIDVEIQEMDLYKPGPRKDWLQGHATIWVDAYDLSKPLTEPAYKHEFTFEFPQGREIEKESQAQVSAFRMKFVQRIATDIAAKFSAAPTQKRMD
jgi:hypothetical protein